MRKLLKPVRASLHAKFKQKPSKKQFTQISLSNCNLCDKVSVKKLNQVFLKTTQKPGAKSVSNHLQRVEKEDQTHSTATSGQEIPQNLSREKKIES